MVRYVKGVLIMSALSLLPVMFFSQQRNNFKFKTNPLDMLSTFVREPNTTHGDTYHLQQSAIQKQQDENYTLPAKKAALRPSPWKSFQNIYTLPDKKGRIRRSQNAYVDVNDDRDVFLFSAVANNNTAGPHWDFFIVNAWETRTLIKEKFMCCLMYEEKIRHVSVNNKILFKPGLGKDPNTVQGRQYVCKNPNRGKNGDVPKAVTVARANKKCPSDTRYYVKLLLPERAKPNSFVVCAKVVYDKVNANYLIEWLEYQKYHGVTKVIVYLSYDTNERAKRVLGYYSREDFVEVIPVGKLPKLEQVRDWATKNNFANVAQDTAVILFDFQSRCHSYTFGAVIDPDEFVLAKDGSKTFVEFMNNIMRVEELSRVAVARFIPEYHILDWDTDSRNKSIPMMLTNHNYHTPPIAGSHKNFYVTSRVVPGSIATHNVYAKTDYISVVVDPKGGVVRHYRKCEGKFENASYIKCKQGDDKILDEEITRIASDIYPHVQKVRDELDIKYPS